MERSPLTDKEQDCVSRKIESHGESPTKQDLAIKINECKKLAKYPSPNISIVDKKKKKSGIYSILETRIGSLKLDLMKSELTSSGNLPELKRSAATFREEDHPRDEDGKFTCKDCGKSVSNKDKDSHRKMHEEGKRNEVKPLSKNNVGEIIPTINDLSMRDTRDVVSSALGNDHPMANRTFVNDDDFSKEELDKINSEINKRSLRQTKITDSEGSKYSPGMIEDMIRRGEELPSGVEETLSKYDGDDSEIKSIQQSLKPQKHLIFNPKTNELSTKQISRYESARLSKGRSRSDINLDIDVTRSNLRQQSKRLTNARLKLSELQKNTSIDFDDPANKKRLNDAIEDVGRERSFFDQNNKRLEELERERDSHVDPPQATSSDFSEEQLIERLERATQSGGTSLGFYENRKKGGPTDAYQTLESLGLVNITTGLSPGSYSRRVQVTKNGRNFLNSLKKKTKSKRGKYGKGDLSISGLKLASLKLQLGKDFDESKINRDDDGKFAPKGGGKGSGKGEDDERRERVMKRLDENIQKRKIKEADKLREDGDLSGAIETYHEANPKATNAEIAKWVGFGATEEDIKLVLQGEEEPPEQKKREEPKPTPAPIIKSKPKSTKRKPPKHVKSYAELREFNEGRDLVKDGHYIIGGFGREGEDTSVTLIKPRTLEYPKKPLHDGYALEYTPSDFKVKGEMVKIGDVIRFSDDVDVMVTGFEYAGDEWEGPSVDGYVVRGDKNHPVGAEKGHGAHRMSEVRSIVKRSQVKMKEPSNRYGKLNSISSSLSSLKLASMKLRLAGDFKESEHPRDEEGKFTCKDCGHTSGSKQEHDEHSKTHQKKQVDTTQVINWMERKVDPDMTGDVNSGFYSELIDEAAEKFNISKEDAEEIWDSGGTTHKKIFTNVTSEEKKPEMSEKDIDQTLIGILENGPDERSTLSDQKLINNKIAPLVRAGFIKEKEFGGYKIRYTLTPKGRKEAQKRLKKYDDGGGEEKTKSPDRAMRGVDTLVESGRISKKEGERLKKIIEEERKYNRASPEERERMDQKIREEEEKEAWESLSPAEKNKIKQLQRLREKMKRKSVPSDADAEEAYLRRFEEEDADEEGRTGKLHTGSLVDDYKTAGGDRYVTYFLLNANTNLKGWGVTPESIPRHIASFKGMPFVITSKKFFPKSVYGEVYDHPSTEHFARLGINRQGRNDMEKQAVFQEEFRVGNIEDFFQKNGDWFAFIKIKPEFANYDMPPLVSPAIFQLNPYERADHITQWMGMHLAGLDEKPAYGNNALYKGSCFGNKEACMRQLSASGKLMLPPCLMGRLKKDMIKLASLRLDMLRSGAQMSTDHPEIQRQVLLKRKKHCSEKN